MTHNKRSPAALPQGFFHALRDFLHKPVLFQHRKRYGLHAIPVRWSRKLQSVSFNTASGMDCMQYDEAIVNTVCDYDKVSIPQAVWIACNDGSYRAQPPSCCFNTASGMDCMQLSSILPFQNEDAGFNTASGMDCMQYRPSQPLGQLNPEAGFLNGSLFWANRRDLAGFFCRQNRLKTSATPVISRKLLSTGKI